MLINRQELRNVCHMENRKQLPAHQQHDECTVKIQTQSEASGRDHPAVVISVLVGSNEKQDSVDDGQSKAKNIFSCVVHDGFVGEEMHQGILFLGSDGFV